MRDFRDAKVMAQTVRATLAAKGLKITISESLELIAKAFGVSAADPPQPIARPAGRVGFSAAMEATLGRAVKLAADRRRLYTTLEHLLLALVDDPDAAAVMHACQVDLDKLKADLMAYIDDDLKSLVGDDGEPTRPTAGFQRVVQRAVIHVQASGRQDVTGANVLVAVFSEDESHAAHFLRRQEMTRIDAVNFIAHGIRKDGGRAA